jgi:S1-C subfamily serine protease
MALSQCSKDESAVSVGNPSGPLVQRRKSPIVTALDRAMPAIVSIVAESVTAYQGKPSVAQKPGTRQFYVIRPVRGVRAVRNGAGVIVDPRGFILTNAHVVKGLDKITVIFSDQRSVEGEVLGVEPAEDLAVIKVDPPYPLSRMIFADSDRLMIGETAIAVGNPFGLGHSVARGIVSATKRNIVWKASRSAYRDLIQTDIPLNVGNSGGPLLNIDGEMIGMNLAEPTGTEGISFAISSNRASVVYEKIINQRQP